MSDYKELSWDDSFSSDFNDSDFVLLPEGDYDFTVESFERARHEGSEWIPPCHKAVLKLRIDAPEGPAIITQNLYLCTKNSCRRDIYRFFESIGQVKDGEDLRPNWSSGNLVGQTGRAHIIQRPDKKDPSKVYNNIKNFCPKQPRKFTPGNF